jgi:sortase (surface protein transpeptidase)
MDIKSSVQLGRKRVYLDSPGLKRRVFTNGNARSDYGLTLKPEVKRPNPDSNVTISMAESAQRIVGVAQAQPAILRKTNASCEPPTKLAAESGLKTRKLSSKKATKVLSAGVMIAGLLIVGLSYRQGNELKAEIAKVTNSAVLGDSTEGLTSDAKPDESPIGNDKLASYSVAANMPRYITIEGLRVKSRVMRVGTTKEGAVGSPRNINDVGWYENSVVPGQEGSSLLVGHNQGWTARGVFADLGTLEQGETIKITYGSGVESSFQIKSVEKVPLEKVDMAKYLTTERKTATIFVMSCSGKYDKTNDEYQERTIVEAVKL